MLAVRLAIASKRREITKSNDFGASQWGKKAPPAVATYQMPIGDNVRRFLLPHLPHLPFNVAGDAVSALVKERLDFV
jgi:hypothetical protein